jgi:hypothetical protein
MYDREGAEWIISEIQWMRRRRRRSREEEGVDLLTAERTAQQTA